MNVLERLVDDISDIAAGDGVRVGAAESVTAGHVAAALVLGGEAAQWFQGSVVAYTGQTKQSVLGVDPGPVITAACAEQMARGAAEVLAADVTVATTGVGGPDPEEGEPAGTVYIAVHAAGGTTSHRIDVDSDDPAEIVAKSTERALELLLGALRDTPSRARG